MTSAQGIDVSAFQLDLAVHDLSGLSFVLTKATDGLSITDPHFAANWATIKHAGLHCGAYHELQAGNPGGQAVRFLAVVHAQGLEPGDMLSVVASDYPGVTDGEVLAFCEAVRAATGGRNPVLPYTDLSVGRMLTATAGAFGDLWVAWPNPTAPGAANWAPAAWRTWRLWQYGTRNVPGLGSCDANAYNGSPADMDTWIGSFRPSPQPPPAPHVGTRTGDTMLYLPTGKGAVLAVPVPTAVLNADGTIAPPSVLRFATNSPVGLEYMLGDSGTWVPLAVDYARSPTEIPLKGAAQVKIQRAGGETTLVTADFA